MATATEGTVSEIAVLRHQAGMAQEIVQRTVDGLSHEDSLIQPSPAGNCLNWVVGHLITVYGHTLRLLGQEPVMSQEALKRYERGMPPLKNAAEAIDFSELVRAWEETSRRVDTGLKRLSADALDRPAPFTPTNNPKETVRSLLTTVSWHQAYHAGQAAMLRRIAGKAGVIG
jgi:uncharacterized damage-inducible protein DinB